MIKLSTNERNTTFGIIGIGYVGLANAIFLAKKYNVTLLDKNENKVKMLNKGILPIKEDSMQIAINNVRNRIQATTNLEFLARDVDYVIVAISTDYDEASGELLTKDIEELVSDLISFNNELTIILKSTVPIGFTKKIKDNLGYEKILFNPEFLREGRALGDVLNPLRVVIGDTTEYGQKYSKIILDLLPKRNPTLIMTNSCEAESIKLFANTYLAMRVAFFNELDTFAEITNLDVKSIIDGVCIDKRIGEYYNNPSFGFGGYCLPKDAKQLASSFSNIPNKLMNSISESNMKRKEHISNMILSKEPRVVGIYGLMMKKDSNNLRNSAIIDVITYITSKKIKVYIYEPAISDIGNYEIYRVHDFDDFKRLSDIIVTNRFTKELSDVEDKVYTRDIFNRD